MRCGRHLNGDHEEAPPGLGHGRRCSSKTAIAVSGGRGKRSRNGGAGQKFPGNRDRLVSFLRPSCLDGCGTRSRAGIGPAIALGNATRPVQSSGGRHGPTPPPPSASRLRTTPNAQEGADVLSGCCLTRPPGGRGRPGKASVPRPRQWPASSTEAGSRWWSESSRFGFCFRACRAATLGAERCLWIAIHRHLRR